MGSSDSIDWCGLQATQTRHSNFAFMAFVKADLLCFVLQWLMLFTNVSFVNATLKYSKCVNYCNLWCKPQELPCPETSRLNRLHQQLINKHVASLDRVIQGYAAYGFRHLFRHSLKVTAVFRIDWYLQWQSQMLPFVLLDYPFFIHMFR